MSRHTSLQGTCRIWWVLGCCWLLVYTPIQVVLLLLVVAEVQHSTLSCQDLQGVCQQGMHYPAPAHLSATCFRGGGFHVSTAVPMCAVLCCCDAWCLRV